jgi:hypothetical protein
MAVEKDEIIVDEEVVEEDDIVEEDPDESVHEESDPEDNDPGDDDEDEDDRVVLIGDEEPEDEDEKREAPKWVKNVRKANRKLESENRRLKRELQERSSEKNPEIVLGEKPTLKSVKYDDKKYEQELAAYYERKRKLEEIEAQKAKALEEQNKKWESKRAAYDSKRSEHSFRDFEEAEEIVTSALDITQQGIIVQGADDSALVVYALGKNPKKLEELTKVKDPVEFAVRIGKLESQLKVTSKKAPAPEKRVTAGKSSGLSGSADSTLERLRAEAEKTGDYTKVIRYRRQRKETD